MSAQPGRQRAGVGSYLIRTGFEKLGIPVETLVFVFVLGHTACYPKSGFEADTPKPFTASSSGSHFMAIGFVPGGPASGTLTSPRAFSG